MREQPVDARHACIVHATHLVTKHLSRDGGLLGTVEVARSCRDHQHIAYTCRFGRLTEDAHARGGEVAVAICEPRHFLFKERLELVALLRVEARDDDAPLPRLLKCIHDAGYLFGCLAGAVDDLRDTLPYAALHVRLGIAQLDERCLAHTCAGVIHTDLACRHRPEKGPQLIALHCLMPSRPVTESRSSIPCGTP